ncbi:hypothetical protein OAP91_02780 [Acidimicrobiia bacterium]|nr:hypothetical protein [Acidimicrobiia bacterium]
MDTLDTYVAHYTPLTERKEHICKSLNDDFINLIFEETLDQEEVTNEMKDKYYSNDESLWIKKCKIYKKAGLGTPEYKILTPGEISLLLKAKNIINTIAQSKKPISLYIEDDAVPVKRYLKKLKKLTTKEQDWDVLFINLGIGKNFLQKKLGQRILNPKKLYMLPPPSSNCTEAILFKKEAAIKIAPYLDAFTLPLDYELAYIFSKTNLNVMTTSKPIFYQGSKTYNFFRKSIFDESVRTTLS